MTLLELTTETDGATVRLALAGELDIASAAHVEQELMRIEGDAPTTIVLDLRELTFMDSTGLRIIVGADARAREHERRLVLVQGPDAVRRLLRMTRLDERLEIVVDPAAVTAS
ncbi:MAG TPA: STAS domain-containing protein [Conexibacter sp.]|jgi:anti-sigma B factor antagonist|nr:STAS domain-containing protein [Conexibacter sp.]